MGFWDDITGKTAADASRAAAADTYAKQQAATTGLTNFADQYPQGFTNLAQSYAPWQATGQQANSAVQNLINNPSSVQSLPGYQFGLDQGAKAIDHSALANGRLFSGKTGKDLFQFGTNYADQQYGNQLARLLGVSQQGLGATNSANALQGTGLQGQLGARTSAYNGLLGSAGTIGQGDVAAANAQSKGMTNLLGLGGSLLGSVLGGPIGGSIYGSVKSGIGGLLADQGYSSGVGSGGYNYLDAQA